MNLIVLHAHIGGSVARPSAQFLVENFGLERCTVNDGKIGIEQAFREQLIHIGEVFLIGGLRSPIAHSYPVGIHKHIVADVPRAHKSVGFQNVAPHAAQRRRHAVVFEGFENVVPIVQRHGHLQAVCFQQILAHENAHEGFIRGFAPRNGLVRLAGGCRRVNVRDNIVLSRVGQHHFFHFGILFQIGLVVGHHRVDNFVELQDYAVFNGGFRAARIRGVPGVFNDIRQFSGNHHQVELLALLAHGRMLPFDVDAEALLRQFKGFDVVVAGQHIGKFQVYPIGNGRDFLGSADGWHGCKQDACKQSAKQFLHGIVSPFLFFPAVMNVRREVDIIIFKKENGGKRQFLGFSAILSSYALSFIANFLCIAGFSGEKGHFLPSGTRRA